MDGIIYLSTLLGSKLEQLFNRFSGREPHFSFQIIRKFDYAPPYQIGKELAYSPQEWLKKAEALGRTSGIGDDAVHTSWERDGSLKMSFKDPITQGFFLAIASNHGTPDRRGPRQALPHEPDPAKF